ncbi:MAG: sirohydrochlorin cobaltochelatase [Deltaproteobacteria bacterium]|nr:sirohydrochlorin cobaltochelatase [Deltaproteobacteria bacterium]
MTEAVILVDHGSRAPEAAASLDEMVGLVQKQRPEILVLAAHMEIAPPSIEEALQQCVTQGARRVTVVPYFLAPGRHIAEDIPALVQTAAARHPQTEVHLAPPLGVHTKLAEVILERLEESTKI